MMVGIKEASLPYISVPIAMTKVAEATLKEMVLAKIRKRVTDSKRSPAFS
jgi:hypothetical protein